MKNEKGKKGEKSIFMLEKIIAEQHVILSSIGDHIMAVVIVDKNGKIVRVNEGFETLTGWKTKEVIGRDLISVLPREDENHKRVPIKERILTKVLKGKVFTNTATISPSGDIERLPVFYYIRKDKSSFPAVSVVSPVEFEKKITGAVEIFYNITREKELEQIKMDFLSLASHQLRTPLCGIKWLIETMHRGITGKMNKKQKEYLDDIYTINEQMIKLVSDILSSLRLQSGKAFIKKEKILVSALFKNILTMVPTITKNKKVVFQGTSDRLAVTVETDLAILEAILRTFLSNALCYSAPRQKVILGVKEESNAVVFFVRDHGVGIPKDEQGRIFERFYRVSNAKNIKSNGSGLGLSIARTLAEKINTELSFKSEENKGATFYIRIPKNLKN